MKAWDELTERGRLLRLRRVALAALERYPVEVTGLSLIGGFMNALYRVDTPDGPLAIRVGMTQIHSDADVDVELDWLDAIAEEGVVNVPAPLRTIDGRWYVHASSEGVPGARRCAVFGWVPGVPIADRIRPDRFHRYGRMSALLHEHGGRYDTPVRPMTWDRVFYFPESFDPVVWDLPESAAAFPRGGLDVLRRSIAIADTRLGSIPDSMRQIVHGDLHVWNVHVHRDELWALDFEDVMWATPAQDLAVTLYYLGDRPDRDELVAAFRRGYEEVAPWPAEEADLDVFMAARRILFVNAVFGIDTIDTAEFLRRSIPKLQAFVDRHG